MGEGSNRLALQMSNHAVPWFSIAAHDFEIVGRETLLHSQACRGVVGDFSQFLFIDVGTGFVFIDANSHHFSLKLVNSSAYYQSRLGSAGTRGQNNPVNAIISQLLQQFARGLDITERADTIRSSNWDKIWFSTCST